MTYLERRAVSHFTTSPRPRRPRTSQLLPLQLGPSPSVPLGLCASVFAAKGARSWTKTKEFIDMFFFWRLIFCSAKVALSCRYTLRRANYDHESRKWVICLNHYCGDPEETEIEKHCWIGVTGTWCKTWFWLGNAKVKCFDTVTLNSPCVTVVSPEFPILVQFLITKPLGRFHGHVTAYVHNASASAALQLGFSHLRYLIIGGSSAQFARQGLLFGTMGQGMLSVWAYTACYHAPRNISQGCMAERTL